MSSGIAFARVRPFLLAALWLTAACAAQVKEGPDELELSEASIDEVQRAFETGSLSAVGLTELYLERIAEHAADSSFYSELELNPAALSRAAELDEIYAKTGAFVGPLHGIVVLLDPDLGTFRPPSTAGFVVRRDGTSELSDDAFVVQRLRHAGAIILGKTRHSALAIAANLATVALAADSQRSLVGSAAANNVIGLRPSLGMVSRTGVAAQPAAMTVVGPVARTVKDTARVLEVIVAVDQGDPATSAGEGKAPVDGYLVSLDADSLRDAQVGAVHELVESSALFGASMPHDPAAQALAHGAFAEVRSRGGYVIDASLAQVAAQVSAQLEQASLQPTSSEATSARLLLRDLLLRYMDGKQLDALVYLSVGPAPVSPAAPEQEMYGQANTLSALTGLPSISVPIGFGADGTPIGMTLLGRAFAEPMLLRLAYAYEQATHHRKPRSVQVNVAHRSE